MTDEELIARLRDWPYQGETMANAAADRIEALVKELTSWQRRCINAEAAILPLIDERSEAEDRAERLEAVLREIESIDVHSGGEIHGVTALQWELAFAHAQDVASVALKGDDHV